MSHRVGGWVKIRFPLTPEHPAHGAYARVDEVRDWGVVASITEADVANRLCRMRDSGEAPIRLAASEAVPVGVCQMFDHPHGEHAYVVGRETLWCPGKET